MREGVVADVVEQGGGDEDAHVLFAQHEGRVRVEETGQKLLGQVIDAQRVLKARVARAWIHQMHVAELGDVAQALEGSGIDEGEDGSGEVDIAPDRVADDLAFFG